LKIFFYIILFTGFSLAGYSQTKPSQVKDIIRVIKLYPNPATNYINFEFNKKSDKAYNLVIFSFIGKKVEDIKINEDRVTVPLTEYYRGIYIYQLRDEQGNIVESGKFQVAR